MKLKIYPKLDSMFEGEETILPYIEDGMEIQMLDDNFEKAVKHYCNLVPSLKEITLHVKMDAVYIDDFIYTSKGIAKIVSYITSIGGLQKTYGVKLNILMHLNQSYNEIKNRGGLKAFNIFEEYLNKYDVLLLLENVLAISGALDKREHVTEFVYLINKTNIKCCLDLCHVYCYLNMMSLRTYVIYKYLDNDTLDRVVHQIHFSDTLNNDGYADMLTHSRAHTALSINKDLVLLDSLGIIDKPLVTEVLENNYANRVDQLKELKLLNLIQKEL